MKSLFWYLDIKFFYICDYIILSLWLYDKVHDKVKYKVNIGLHMLSVSIQSHACSGIHFILLPSKYHKI